MSLELLTSGLSMFGRQCLETDYQSVLRRDGGKTSRADFALGWMACAVRGCVWAYFTPTERDRIIRDSLH